MNNQHKDLKKQHEKYWSTKQICERFGNISSRTLSRWVESRGFPPSVTPDGGSNLYVIADVLAWEENYFTTALSA